MHITDRAIELPRIVLLGAALLCITGLVAILNLPKERTPRVKLPVIIVAVANPGGQPADNEAEIVRKVEDELAKNPLDGLKDHGGILSQAVNGAAVMAFIFDDVVDVTEARRSVTDLINRVKTEFPLLAQRDPGPIINDVAFEDWPIVQVFVSGGTGDVQRRRVADRLEDLIEKVSGVSGVDTFGGREEEVQVEVDPHRMAMYGFTYGQIQQAIARANLDAPSGAVEGAGGVDTRIRTRGKLRDLDAIRDVPLGQRDGRPLLLADVADVRLGHKSIESLASYGGAESVVLLVRARTDIDVLQTSYTIEDAVARFQATDAAEGTRIGIVRSQAREIHFMLGQLGSDALSGTLLVLITLWLFMGFRNGLLISLAIPLATLGGAAFMWLCKRSLIPDLAINNMTIFACILITGLVVDGCIVVAENIYRHRELGRSPIESAKRGTREVSASLVSASLTTLAAFAPMFIVRGIMGDFMSLLPIVVIFSLGAAMLADHFILPVLSLYFMKSPKGSHPNPDDAGLSFEEQDARDAERMVQSSRFRRNYVQALSYALHHRVLILTLTVVTTVTPLLLYRAGAIGVEFFPDGDAPWIEVNFELPLGSSMEKRTAQVAREVEAAVLRAVRPEEWNSDTPDGQPVKPVTLLGRPDALNINLQESTNAGPEFGKVYVELSLPGTRQRDSEAIRAAIEREMPPLPGVTVRTVAFKEGPPSGRPIGVRILGQNATYEELEVLADQIEAILRSVPGAKDVVTDYRLRQEIEVEPNRVMSRIFDIDAADIASSVHFALEGLKVGEVDFGRDETIDIRLRNRPGDRDEVEDLANLPIRSPTGKVVALEQVASIERRAGANVLKHYDSQRVINVECDLHEGVLTDDVKLALVQALRPDLSTAQQRALTLDRQNKIISSTDKVTIEFGGENEIRDDALEDLTMAMILAMGIILIILVVEFNSFIQAFIVLFTVPLSLVGVGLGLMVCGMNFSVAAMIGVVALAGVVVDNAVVLLDFINRLRDAGLPLDKAVTYAGSLRLRPILANTVTTVGGMLPMAMNLSGGSEFFQPLTIAFIFGLLFADALTLLVLPIAVYSLDARKRASWLDPMLREDLVGQPPQAPQPLPAPLTALADAVRNVVQPAPALSPALAPTLAPALAALAAAANPSPSPTAALPAAPTPPAPADADQPQPLRHFHDADERRRPRRL